jgi:hypothetical protein
MCKVIYDKHEEQRGLWVTLFHPFVRLKDIRTNVVKLDAQFDSVIH